MPDRATQRVVLVPHYHGAFRTLLDLATYLRERDIAEPLFVIHFDDRDAVLSQLREADIDYRLHRRYVIEKVPLLGQLIKLLRDRRFSRRLARRLPDVRAMVCTVETHRLEYALIPALNKRGVNTIVLQWAQSGGKDYYRRVRSRNEKPSLARRLRSACRRVFRGALAKTMNVQLPSSYGKGPARHFAVMGEYYKELFISEGVRPEKVQVTGHPEADYLYELAGQSSRPGWREDVAAEFDLDPRENIWLLGREAIAYFGLVSPEKDKADLTAALEILTQRAGGGQVVLKLHPRDSVDYYQFVAARFPGVRLIKDCDLYRLMSICDLYVSQISSTMMWALALDKPVISYDFNSQEQWRSFRDRPGIHQADTPEQFAQRLDEIQQPGFDEIQKHNCRLTKQRYMTFDGKARERIAELILRGPSES